MLFISNTLDHKKTTFIPHQEKRVTMYICGITPYDNPHIGHGRCYVFFDVVYRFLTVLGYDVTYCRNYTDIDDKLLNKAEQLFGDKKQYLVVADRCIAQFQQDMHLLNNKTPTVEPRVTDNIDQIIAFIKVLIEKKYAYVSHGSVYFAIESFPDYGALSNQHIESLQAGTREETRDEKRNPLDFSLWKAETESFFWNSPWGIGRPGWHIECSALAKTYLGEHVDIHGGGLDLIFPHHENEIAQSESYLGQQFVKYWLHVGLVMAKEEKMSKSLGNFVYLKDIFQLYDPMVLRYYYLTHHYRSPLPFSTETMDSCQKAYKKLCAAFVHVEAETEFIHVYSHPISQKLLNALYDDINTAAFFGVVFEHLPQIKEDVHLQKITKMLLQSVCGLTLNLLPEKELSEEVKQLLEAREIARKNKDWDKADVIRDQLIALGVEVQDKKTK
jgi:cysteinyl-tRNA synthetase